ncbi:DUF624 domain-containing protein [Bifidobacterium amazonense]|uniref:DUF624 domain-containing protein n=1 Tax=Bifidobacterium amazonense TaxID=2809027 RepID=A0ABS9VVB2_9BIFI|nr:DUF624 domain-containing protein [Bifidobacterium amazonense]MCH9276040.1 DUF624 domain-containing protein [Bifidobacterium amazonense]
MKLFDPDNKFWQFVALCLRYCALNLVFLVTCIPLVTVGPARAALYSTVFAYTDNEDIHLVREYLKRFKREFLPALGSSVIFIVLIAIATFSIVFWSSLDTDLAYVTLPVLIIVGVVTLLTFEYYSPLQARYANTFGATLSNAFKMPWAVFKYTLGLLAIDVIGAALFLYTGWFRIAFVLLGFSWLAYAKSLIFLRAFAQVSGDPDKPREAPDYTMPSGSIQ